MVKELAETLLEMRHDAEKREAATRACSRNPSGAGPAVKVVTQGQSG